MKDLNFFEFYIERKEFKLNKYIILYVATGFIFCTLIIYSIFNQIKIQRLESEVNKLQIIVEDSNTLERINEIKEQENELKDLKNELEKVKKLNSIIEKENFIDEKLLRLVASRIPKDTFLESINFSQGEIHISGVAKDQWSIAEFSKGIEYIENIDEIFISNITQNKGNYCFDLNIILKDVINHGEGS